MSIISNYDEGNYCYENYWVGRDYENQSELLALGSLLDSSHEGWMADLGCGFGRLAPAYLPSGQPVFLVDYSLRLLEQAQLRLGPPSPSRQFIAANLNHLPFITQGMATTIMVRVMHHLASYDRVLQEVTRVCQREWILEFPQKLHALARIRALVRGQLRNLSEQVPLNLAGRPDRVFLNYHPKAIRHRLQRLGWSIRSTRSVSNFRIPWVKNHVKTQHLMFLEYWAQTWLAPLGFGPSLWLSLLKERNRSPETLHWAHVLACPGCGSGVHWEGDMLSCQGCGERFHKRSGIWDMRWPRPGL